MVRRCAARPRLSSLGPLTALMCSQFTPFHFLLLRSPAWHVILLHFTPLGLCAPSLCQCSVPSLHSALLLAALRSSVAVAAGEALRQAGGRGSSSAGSGGGGARGRGSAIQPAGRGAETELAGAPAATGTRVRKGRGFTSQYAFARRYRTPSPSPSPTHSLTPPFQPAPPCPPPFRPIPLLARPSTATAARGAEATGCHARRVRAAAGATRRRSPGAAPPTTGGRLREKAPQGRRGNHPRVCATMHPRFHVSLVHPSMHLAIPLTCNCTPVRPPTLLLARLPAGTAAVLSVVGR